MKRSDLPQELQAAIQNYANPDRPSFNLEFREKLGEIMPEWVPGKKRLDWDFEFIREMALTYDRRIDFQKGCGAAYQAATRMGILDQVCSHMEVAVHKRVADFKLKILQFTREWVAGHSGDRMACSEIPTEWKSRAYAFTSPAHECYDPDFAIAWLRAGRFKERKWDQVSDGEVASLICSGGFESQEQLKKADSGLYNQARKRGLLRKLLGKQRPGPRGEKR